MRVLLEDLSEYTDPDCRLTIRDPRSGGELSNTHNSSHSSPLVITIAPRTAPNRRSTPIAL